MINLINYIIGSYGILSVRPLDTGKGKGLGWYILFTTTQIYRKYKTDKLIEQKDTKILEQENELRIKNETIQLHEERIKVLEEREQINSSNNDYVNSQIDTPTMQDLRLQNKEFSDLMKRNEQLIQERIKLEEERNALIKRSDEIRSSIDNDQILPEEYVKSFEDDLEKTISKAENNIDLSNNILNTIKEIYKKFIGGENNILESNPITQLLSIYDADVIIYLGGAILITWSLLSIFFVILGSYLIRRLGLKGKYILLDQIISYREKFSKYYIRFDIISILIVSSLMFCNYLLS